MKKQFIFLLIFVILGISAYPQVKFGEPIKKPMNGHKLLTPKEALIADLNSIMDSYAAVPNDCDKWANIAGKFYNLLAFKWRTGVLQGYKPEEAFFVKVGKDTMTQDDLANGRLIVLIGFSMIKPAEFEVIKLVKQLL